MGTISISILCLRHLISYSSSRLTSATDSTFDTWDSTSGSTTDTMSGPFHSEMEAPGGRTVGNMALMPLRQTVKNAGRGFAPDTQDDDIVDEVIRLFKPNILFKSFEMKDSVDRVLVYVTLYIVECLKKLTKIEGKEKALLDVFNGPWSSLHTRRVRISSECLLHKATRKRGRGHEEVHCPASTRNRSETCREGLRPRRLRRGEAKQVVDLLGQEEVPQRLPRQKVLDLFSSTFSVKFI